MGPTILDHFRSVDPHMHNLATIHVLEELVLPINLYERLVRSIIGQQLSVKAAQTIYNRLLAITPGGELTPEAIMQLSDDQIRGCGVSYAKIASLRDLARRVNEGVLDIEALHTMDDEEVIAKLSEVRGIGTWTAEMFLIFSLGRPNIYSVKDAGLRRAINILYGDGKSLTDHEIEIVVARWHPYKSYASRLLWRSLDNEPGA